MLLYELHLNKIRLSHYGVCRIMTFVALWRLSSMTFVALWRLSHYDVCRLWHLSPYDVCRIMTFCRIMTVVVYDVCRIMMFVALWRLSPIMTFVANTVGFVAVSNILINQIFSKLQDQMCDYLLRLRTEY